MGRLTPPEHLARPSGKLGCCGYYRRALLSPTNATLMVEILKDNARPEAGEVYASMDMGWAKLVGQIAQAYVK